jgi:hypothetical protein
MRLLMWAGAMVVSMGALGGVLGALSNRAAHLGPTFSESFSAFLAGRARYLASNDRTHVRSSG